MTVTNQACILSSLADSQLPDLTANFNDQDDTWTLIHLGTLLVKE
jgi:hypothetical protein